MTTTANDNPLSIPGPRTPAQVEMIAERAREYASAINKNLDYEIKSAVIFGAFLGFYLGRLEGGAL